MFDSQILEVVIGLLFIFLLFSLLATSFQEVIANFRNSRGKMLQEAIYNMTGTTKPRHYRKSQTLIAYILLALSLLGLVLTGEFISPPAFLAPFFDRYGEVVWWHSWVFLVFSLVYVYIWGQYYWQNVRKQRVESNELAKKILAHPRFERLGRKNSIDSLTAYIPGSLFSKIFTEVLGEEAIHSGSFKTLSLSQDVNDYYLLEPRTRTILEEIYKDSGGNSALFQAGIENWFNETMDQVQGWYKREAQRWLFFIGLLFGIMFNVNPFEVSRHLNESQDARRVILAAAEGIALDPKMDSDTVFRMDFAKQLETLESAYRKQQIQIDSLEYTLTKHLDKEVEGQNTSPDSLKKSLVQQTLKFVKSQMLRDTTVNKLYTYGEELGQHIRAVNKHSALLGIGWTDETLRKWEGANIATIFIHFLGLLIFGLAISLGAPFWFDLLKRFVNIRHAGAKPKRNEENSEWIDG
ncbi:MAG: hypothetical protein AAF694_20475 [Bacteroidota bacterium]